jgi:hypothetical protein
MTADLPKQNQESRTLKAQSEKALTEKALTGKY